MQIAQLYRRRVLDQNSTPPPPTPTGSNVYFGGVSSSINTPTLLADKISNYPIGTSFDPININNFTIVGDNIECLITVDFQLSGNKFTNNLSLTYFKEKGGFCKYFESLYFAGAENLVKIELPSVKSSGVVAGLQRNYKLEIINIANCLNIGGTNGFDNFFHNATNSIPFKVGCKIYVDPSMQTINGGGVEGDLSFAANSRAGILKYITNSTVPNGIDGNNVRVYANALQMIDDGSSANQIDFFTDIEINGVPYPDVVANKWIRGLTPNTSYNIKATAVDVNYNKSETNAITKVTTSTQIDAIDYVSISEISGDTLITQINDSIGVFKSSGVWDRVLGLYPIIGKSYNETKYNLKDPRDLDSAYRLVNISGTVYGENRFLSGNIDTFILPASLGNDNYHASFYSLTQNTTVSTLINASTSGSSLIRLLTLNNSIYNDGYDDGGVARLISNVGSSTGLLTIQRDDINIQKNYRNGVLVGSDSNGNLGTMPTDTFKIYGGSLTGGFVVISKSLTDIQNQTLYEEINKINLILGR